MYNYTQFPNNFNNPQFINQSNRPINNDSRFVGGGFLGPFLLGGITGGLAAPLFYGNNNYGRPNYYANNYYYPYPPYYGYYR